jgi:zinc transporter 5/7
MRIHLHHLRKATLEFPYRAQLTGHRSWLELPEALTALLIPLPYLLASLAYPSGIGAKLPLTLSEAVAESAPELEPASAIPRHSLLHALALSSAMLLFVGITAKVNSSLQPLDRRKEEKGTFNIKNAPKQMASNVLSVLLPFYASLQLGGAKTAIVLLVAVAAGLGALDQKPGKHTSWDDFRRTLRTRKVTCGVLLLSIIADSATSGHTTSSLMGHAALLLSMLLVPPPLPMAGWSIMTEPQSQDSYMGQKPSRALLPKPSSRLINTTESQLLTIASGLALTVITVLYSLFASDSPFPLPHTLVFLVLSAASATALVFFSLPASLRSSKTIGLKLGAFFIAAFSFWEHYSAGHIFIAFPWVCAMLVGAVAFDTRPHSHAHSDAGHKHAQGHDHSHTHEHHLHGNHSRLSAFLIARATPGSIIHSVLIEKDSRRIAYFGV